MQRWTWEVTKMFLYMAFPVTCFHFFNSPQLFEKSLIELKDETYPTVSTEMHKELQTFWSEAKAERELKKIKAMEAQYGMQ